MPTEYDRLIYASRAEAQEVVDAMCDILLKSKYVTVSDFYALSGVSSTWVDDNYGWESLVGVIPVPHNGGFQLNLPVPEQIK